MIRTRGPECPIQGLIAIALFFVVVAPSIARAQQTALVPLDLSAASVVEAPVVASPEAAVTPVNTRATRGAEFTAWRKDAGVILPLYSGFAVLQALDVQSTTRALRQGGTEQNPMLAGVASNTAALSLLKAATTASTVYAIEHVRKKNRFAAIVTMVAVDSVYAAIVVHNYRAIR